jgi:hypothetical protein
MVHLAAGVIDRTRCGLAPANLIEDFVAGAAVPRL